MKNNLLLILNIHFVHMDIWYSKFYIKITFLEKDKNILDFHLSSSRATNIKTLCVFKVDFKVQIVPVFTGWAYEKPGISALMWSTYLIVYFSATPTLDIVIFNCPLALGKQDTTMEENQTSSGKEWNALQ